ncbi:hypothetical protein GCM10008019_32380 [Deinococcus soli (ex Cha et al. 2016)]|nr:hypothetical protein GCM10008019_32380 [Deinococcus soli (ex Cha et al. 2016)]
MAAVGILDRRNRTEWSEFLDEQGDLAVAVRVRTHFTFGEVGETRSKVAQRFWGRLQVVVEANLSDSAALVDRFSPSEGEA